MHRNEIQRRLWRNRVTQKDKASLNQQLQEADKDVEERERLVEEHCAAARGHLEEVLEDPDVSAVLALAHADATWRRTIEAGKRVEVARRVLEAAVWNEDMPRSIRLEWIRIIRHTVRRQHDSRNELGRRSRPGAMPVCSSLLPQLKNAVLEASNKDQGLKLRVRDSNFLRGFVGESKYEVDYFDDEEAGTQRSRTIWAKVPSDRIITVDGNSIDKPAVVAELKKQFPLGYCQHKYKPTKEDAQGLGRLGLRCSLGVGRHGCPKVCRINFADGKATIRVGDHDHEHPDHDSDKLLNRKNLSESSSKCYCCKVNFEPGEIFISKLSPLGGRKKERFHLPCLFESFLRVRDGVESNYRNRFTGLPG